MNLDAWRPSAAWASTVLEALTILEPGTASAGEEVHAWAQLAMMLGDTGANELGLLVVRHARARLPAGADPGRLGGHEALFVLDLGLGHAAPSGTVRPHGSAVDDWLDRTLPRFGGTLERAAWFALRLAAVRTGARAGPEPTP